MQKHGVEPVAEPDRRERRKKVGPFWSARVGAGYRIHFLIPPRRYAADRDKKGCGLIMHKKKKKLTPAQKAEKKRMRKESMTIFVNGKQKRVKREPTVDGIPADDFIRINADPIWLLQEEMYEELYQWEQQQERKQEGYKPESSARNFEKIDDSDEDLPF